MSQRNRDRELAARYPRLILLITAFCLQSQQAVGDEQNAMVFIPARRLTVGTSWPERTELAKRFDCHPTWLGDDLLQHEVSLSAFWIDRHPVTNAQYLAFVETTGHPRPSWWSGWSGLFPTEYADHPLVGVSGKDAATYARWVGKRLPSAQEWEAAISKPDRSLFAWGDEWPGPLKFQRPGRIFWELPGTRPVGTGGCGQSTAGVEDFAGQALEWVSDVVPHHGVQFQLMKAASWFHEDPVNFRIASGWYAYEGWRSSFTGFRCALDADIIPPKVQESKSPSAISSAVAKKQLQVTIFRDRPKLAAAGGNSRHISISVPMFGHETISLAAPETIIWNGSSVMTWRKTPDMTWQVRTTERAAYEMRFSELKVNAEFFVDEDSVEQRFTAFNLTGRPGSFRTSSCFNLQGHPMFYDCEQLRTYVLNAAGKFLPIRRLSRGGNCVRWITGPGAAELGQDLRWSVLAVISRDGRSIIATGRAGKGSGFSVATNMLFTCLHTDASVQVAPGQQATTRQFFWFLKGTLDDLLKRARRDLILN
jgi:formylglycine-generating enzyme required for sulfatase activity